MSTFVQQIKTDNKVTSINLIPSAKNLGLSQVIDSYQDLKAKLWCYGYPIKLQQVKQDRIASLPDYCFNYSSCWLNKSRYQPLNLNQIENIYYVRQWQSVSEVDRGLEESFLNKQIIIFYKDSNKYISKLVTKLKDIASKVICINHTNNSQFIINKNLLSLDVNNSTHLNQLSDYMKNFKIIPDITLYFSSYKSDEIITFHYLFKSLYQDLNRQHIFIAISFNNYNVTGDEKLSIIPSPIAGIIKSIPIYNQLVKAFGFDCTWNDANNLFMHINFLLANFNRQGEYVLRHNKFWQPTYKQIDLSVKQKSQKQLTLDEVNYLITGGLGGVGYILAEYISQKVSNATIILLGRKSLEELDNYNKNKLLNLKQNNNHIEYIQHKLGFDSSNLLKSKIKSLGIREFHVVLHTAGVGARSATLQMEDKDIQNIVCPKVLGTLDLIKNSKYFPTKIFIACSSIYSVIPSYGNLEYSAANVFLDELSFRNFEKIDKFITINLNQIIDKGMTYDLIQSNQLSIQNSFNSIHSREIISIFNKVLSGGMNNVILSKYSIDRLLNQAYSKFINETKSAELRGHKVIEECSELQYKIAKVFCQVLGINSISLYSSFFDLGGNSLNAIQLLYLLKLELNINISLTDIMSKNSISKIYKSYFSGTKGVKNENRNILVVLKYNAAKKNVFLLHPVGGTLMFYMNIVNKLSNDYNYYGIQNINAHIPNQIKVDSLESLCKIYMNEILKIQPKGSYILMGYSLGGALAYEIAQQLHSMGKRIKNISMFDTWAKFAPAFYDEIFFKSIMTQHFDKNEISEEQRQIFLKASWQMMQLNLKYIPRKSNFSIKLYKASILNDKYLQNGYSNDNYWQQYTSRKMKIYDVYGDHDSIWQDKGLEQIITYLNNNEFTRKKSVKQIINYLYKRHKKLSILVAVSGTLLFDYIFDIFGILNLIVKIFPEF